MANYIGLDIHSKTCSMVVLDKRGNIKIRQKIETNEKKLIETIRSIKNPKKLVIEELGISQWIYTLLKDEVDEMIVCSPAHLPNKIGPKNDYADAFEMADLLRCESKRLVPVFHDDSEIMQMRALISGYHDLNNALVRTKNQMNAILKQQGLKIENQKDYLCQSKLDDFKNSNKHFVYSQLQKQLNVHLEQRETYLLEFKKNKKRFKEIRQLMSIPGIGMIFANELLTAIVTPHRFANKYKFFSYCRLIKYQDESDGTVYKKRSSFGRKDLKAVFKNACMACLRGTSALREYYDVHREMGKSHQAASSAVCRKLAAIVLSVLKTEKKYDDKKLRKEIDNLLKSFKTSM